MAANQDFEFEVEYVVPEQKDISGTGQFISNCQKCQFTCHFPCKHAKDEDRIRCFAMDAQGYCRICPGRCSYKDHYNQKFKWDQVVRKVKRSSEEVRQRFQSAADQSASSQGVVDRMTAELARFEKDLMKLVETTYPLIKRLDEIALRPHPFSAPEYIDLMIKAEEQEHRDGFLKRIETLKSLKQMADITSKLIRKESVFDASGATTSSK